MDRMAGQFSPQLLRKFPTIVFRLLIIALLRPHFAWTLNFSSAFFTSICPFLHNPTPAPYTFFFLSLAKHNTQKSKWEGVFGMASSLSIPVFFSLDFFIYFSGNFLSTKTKGQKG
jgi:hypothetical protein